MMSPCLLAACRCRYIGATINDVDVDKVSEEFGGLKIVSDGSPEQFMAIQGVWGRGNVGMVCLHVPYVVCQHM
jgi:hypothetical protein